MDILQAQGIEDFELEDGELIAGVIVIAKVIDADGDTFLRSKWSEGMPWFERIGILRVAERNEHGASGD